MSGCQCNNPNVWEYGPCDYCSSTDCHECGHELDACPKDCDCECNQNDDPESED